MSNQLQIQHRWKDASGLKICEFPPYELISTLPESLRSVFSRKAISHSDEYYSAFVDNLLNKIEKGPSVSKPSVPIMGTEGFQANSPWKGMGSQSKIERVPAPLLTLPPLPVSTSSAPFSGGASSFQAPSLSHATASASFSSYAATSAITADFVALRRDITTEVHDLSREVRRCTQAIHDDLSNDMQRQQRSVHERLDGVEASLRTVVQLLQLVRRFIESFFLIDAVA